MLRLPPWAARCSSARRPYGPCWRATDGQLAGYWPSTVCLVGKWWGSGVPVLLGYPAVAVWQW